MVHLLVQLIVPHLRVLEHLLHGVHRAEGEAGRLHVQCIIKNDKMKFRNEGDFATCDLTQLSSKKYLKNWLLTRKSNENFSKSQFCKIYFLNVRLFAKST